MRDHLDRDRHRPEIPYWMLDLQDRLYGTLDELGGAPEGLTPVIEQCLGLGSVNVYPSGTPGRCHQVCYVHSVLPEHGAGRRSRSCLTFEKALATIRDHAGICPGTRRVILITNNWEPRAWFAWRDSLARLRDHGIELVIYLKTGAGVTIAYPS